MSTTQTSEQGDQRTNLATAIAEVSERASVLVREEIELAKAEINQKATRLAKGAVVGMAAGIFFFTALFFVLIGCAWLLYFELPIGNQFTYFYGFFAMAIILIALGVIAGLVAARAVKAGAPPTPTMAIEEARKIRESVSAGQPGPSSGAPQPAPQPATQPATAPGPSAPAGPSVSASSPAGGGSDLGRPSVPGAGASPAAVADPPADVTGAGAAPGYGTMSAAGGQSDAGHGIA